MKRLNLLASNGILLCFCIGFNRLQRACHAPHQVDAVDLILLWFSPREHECLALLDRAIDRSNRIIDCK